MHLLDERLQLIGLRDWAGSVGEGRRNESRLEIAIKQSAHARRKNERGQEILVHAAAADDV